ncbi:hypothetical protein BpHYR1_014711 [Brachionus plicatilis]|uniref:Uncharacterized protein n=1 Tax=Brachionus plicatilis TaxID=10195 RepID=A0A3M7RFP8_BRAPC|nr:hypothetical protein BpHYR1_014711 [Brachionus plicatilis]
MTLLIKFGFSKLLSQTTIFKFQFMSVNTDKILFDRSINNRNDDTDNDAEIEEKPYKKIRKTNRSFVHYDDFQTYKEVIDLCLKILKTIGGLRKKKRKHNKAKSTFTNVLVAIQKSVWFSYVSFKKEQNELRYGTFNNDQWQLSECSCPDLN